MSPLSNPLATAICLLAGLAASHLIIKNPVPFGVSTLNNSPLNNAKPGTSESDFPCKQRPGVYDITAMNYMKVGETQLLDFIGSSSHGGGTCQLAVSLDEQPTANSTFKIIQVFEGGCPIDSDGNGDTHPFTFTIPSGFPNGVSTFAWVWYNRIGDREIYMNCAPITVSGGSNDLSYYNSLPNMYVINLPTTECESGEGSNAVSIPHPGQFIMQEPAGQSVTAANGPSCSASAAAMTQGVVGYQSATVTTNGAAYSGPASNMDSTGAANSQATPASKLPAGGSGGAGTTAPTNNAGSTTTAASNGTATSGASSAKLAAGSQTATSGAQGSTKGSGVASFSAIASSASTAASSATSPAGSSAPTSSASSAASPAGSSAATSAAASSPASPTGSSAASPATSAGSSATSAASSAAGSSTGAASSMGMSSSAPNATATSAASHALSGSSTPAGSSAATPAPSTSAGGSGTGSQSCNSADEGLHCSANGKQFGLCANGLLVWQDVAPGTRCEKGQILRRRNAPVPRADGKGFYFRA